MSTTQLIESDETAENGELTSLLQRLANHLSKRGTKPTRAHTRVAAYYRSIGKPMPRDWRHVAKRYLAKYSPHGSDEWHIGGQHVGLTHGRPGAIGEVERQPRGSRHTQLEIVR